MTPRRDERGQATVMIIGLCGVLAMGVAVVTDASAAYLQRQGLDNLADGAALAGADLGAAGDEVYTGGLGVDRLAITEAEARAAVQDYLVRAGAHTKYPGSEGRRVGRPDHPDRPGPPDRPAAPALARARWPGQRADRRHRVRDRGRG